LLHKVKELQFRSRNSSVSIVASLRTGRSRVRISAKARDISILQNVQTDPVAHPGPYSVGTGVLTLGYSGRIGVEGRMSAAVLVLPLYALVA